MNEFKTQEPEPLKQLEVTYQRYSNKYCTKARTCTDPSTKMRNEIVDMVYIRILSTVKKLYSQLPDPTSRMVYERNRKPDRTCSESMWDFATPTFRFNLSCDPESQFWINYDFYNCPFEDEIMALFNDGGLIRYMARVKSPNYPKYFNDLIENQTDSIYSLKPF